MIREVTTYQAVCDRCGRKTGRYNSMEKLTDTPCQSNLVAR